MTVTIVAAQASRLPKALSCIPVGEVASWPAYSPFILSSSATVLSLGECGVLKNGTDSVYSNHSYAIESL